MSASISFKRDSIIIYRSSICLNDKSMRLNRPSIDTFNLSNCFPLSIFDTPPYSAKREKYCWFFHSTASAISFSYEYSLVVLSNSLKPSDFGFGILVESRPSRQGFRSECESKQTPALRRDALSQPRIATAPDACLQS